MGKIAFGILGQSSLVKVLCDLFIYLFIIISEL